MDTASVRFPNVDPVTSATNCEEAFALEKSIDWPYVRVRLDGTDIPSMRGRGVVCHATTSSGKRLAEDILPEANDGFGHNTCCHSIPKGTLIHATNSS